MKPEVLADPVGVVAGLVLHLEPALNRVTVTDVVESVAGGRSKRRRLAQSPRPCSTDRNC